MACRVLISTSLKKNGKIHRDFNDFGKENTELAFKSVKTARYDDIYYTATPEKVDEIVEPDENAFESRNTTISEAHPSLQNISAIGTMKIPKHAYERI